MLDGLGDQSYAWMTILRKLYAKEANTVRFFGVAVSSFAAVPVHVVTVVQKNLPQLLHSTGRVMGTVVSYIQTEVSGQVDMLPFRSGDRVKKVS